MIVVDRHDATPYYRQIHRQVVQGIQAGIYHADDRLPSIRSFAVELGVSRNTVEQAYLTLVEEGYVRARQGSGYYINPPEHPGTTHRAPAAAAPGLAELRAFGDAACPDARYDLAGAAMEPEAFPYYRWARISREVMLDAGREAACRPTDPRGVGELREQAARYLARDAGVFLDPAQLVFLPTAQAALSVARRLAAPDGTPLAVADIRGHEFRLDAPDAPAAPFAGEGGALLDSFEFTLGPSMGFACLALPADAMLRWLRAGAPGAMPVPWQVQATMAQMMRQDLWSGHVRRLQTRYRRKHGELLARLQGELPGVLECAPSARGPFIEARAEDGRAGGELARLARERGVRVGVAGDAVLLGYAAIPASSIAPAVRLLAQAWG